MLSLSDSMTNQINNNQMKRVIDFLKTNHVMTLASSSGDKPRASVLEYYMVEDAMIFATSLDSIKAVNIKANNRVSVSVHNMPLFVTLDGHTEVPSLSETECYNEQLFVNHPEFKQMIEGGTMDPFVYFKVVVETAYYNDYSAGMAPTEVING